MFEVSFFFVIFGLLSFDFWLRIRCSYSGRKTLFDESQFSMWAVRDFLGDAGEEGGLEGL